MAAESWSESPSRSARDETCPVSTGRGTRHVQLVREGRGGRVRARARVSGHGHGVERAGFGEKRGAVGCGARTDRPGGLAAARELAGDRGGAVRRGHGVPRRRADVARVRVAARRDRQRCRAARRRHGVEVLGLGRWLPVREWLQARERRYRQARRHHGALPRRAVSAPGASAAAGARVARGLPPGAGPATQSACDGRAGGRRVGEGRDVSD